MLLLEVASVGLLSSVLMVALFRQPRGSQVTAGRFLRIAAPRHDDRSNQVHVLMEAVQQHYPKATDWDVALALFRRAIALTGPAPTDPAAREALDLGDVGFAFWGAWNCLDALGRPRGEINALVAEAEIKSPMTAKRIRDSLAELEAINRTELVEAELLKRATAFECKSRGEISRDVRAALTMLRSTHDWYRMRDIGVALSKGGYADLAWGTLQAALLSCASRGDGIGAVHFELGTASKREKRYDVAALQFLLSYRSVKDGANGNAAEQLRVCLKKAGCRHDAPQLRDELVGMAGHELDGAVVERLREMLKDQRIAASAGRHDGGEDRGEAS